MINRIKEDLEFNETWWNAAQEGEVICQDEIEIAKEMTVHIRYLLDELEKADKEIAKYHKLHDDGYNEMRIMNEELEKAHKEIERLKAEAIISEAAYDELHEQAGRWQEESGN